MKLCLNCLQVLRCNVKRNQNWAIGYSFIFGQSLILVIMSTYTQVLHLTQLTVLYETENCCLLVYVIMLWPKFVLVLWECITAIFFFFFWVPLWVYPPHPRPERLFALCNHEFVAAWWFIHFLFVRHSNQLILENIISVTQSPPRIRTRHFSEAAQVCWLSSGSALRWEAVACCGENVRIIRTDVYSAELPVPPIVISCQSGRPHAPPPCRWNISALSEPQQDDPRLLLMHHLLDVCGGWALCHSKVCH